MRVGSAEGSSRVLGMRETPLSAEEGGGNLSIVKLLKSGENYLGATVRAEGESVVIGRIVKGGVAEKSRLLKEGDEIWEVNGVTMKGRSVNEVCDLLRSMSGELTFVIRPAEGRETAASPEVPEIRHMRAQFDYDPEDDFYVPCRELALKFQKRDVLHIISMSDEQWWQGFRDGDDPGHHSLAGLVPSAGFQLQRELYKREVMGENAKNSGKRRSKTPEKIQNSSSPSLICGKRKNNAHKKRTPEHKGSPAITNGTLATDEVPENEVHTYEEVSLYLARAGRKRPVVLVGPPNVGCLELRQKLMETEPDKFAGIVPHTSRAKKAGETDGVQYHFLSRPEFQNQVSEGKFVEYGEWEKALFGTSTESIRRVIAKGLTPLLTLKPQSLKALRSTGLMPYVVFVSPRSLERLRLNARASKASSNLKEEELKGLMREAEAMERDWGHLFDKVLLYSDLQSAYTEMRNTIHLLETEPQWIPVEWLQSENSKS